MKKVVLFLVALCLSFQAIGSYRILVLTPVGNMSQKIFFMGFVKELISRGHHVTVVSAYPEAKPITNLRDVVHPVSSTATHYVKNIFDEGGPAQTMNNLLYKGHILCNDILERKDVQELKKEKFDVVLLSTFFSFCFHSLIHHFQVPYIYISAIGYESFADIAGQLKYPSFIPNTVAGQSSPLSYTDRFKNQISYLFIGPKIINILYSNMRATCQERGLCPPDMPSFYEMDKNVSLIIVNSIRTLQVPLTPTFPNLIFAGGAHIKKSKPLPLELEKWVTESGEAGFIFFSLGSCLNSTEMPDNYRKIVLDTFEKLEQRVLMKWDGELLNLPANVRVEKWLPQKDILGHSKLRLFITHGGLQSSMEATFNGVPLLGLPLYSDQYYNMNQAASEGWARVLNWKHLTTISFMETVDDILKDKKLKELCKTRSNLMKDLPIDPDKDAAFWVEYVIRNKGAPHLRSPLHKLSWIELNNIDVWVAIVSFVFLMLFLFYRFIKFILQHCLIKSKNKTD